jgi:hypothetical protein
VSTLAWTDPELIERFDNFAFDDVGTRLMVQLPLPGQATTTPASSRSSATPGLSTPCGRSTR